MEVLRPWSGLRPSVAELLRPALPGAVDAAILAIEQELPAYRAGLGGDFGRTIRRGVEIALTRLLDLMGTDGPALDERARQVYEDLGEGEGAQGRSMEILLAAYRIGARVTWAEFAGAAVRGGVRIEQMVTLAEAIFVYIDELSAASASGYARQQAAEAGYRDLVRSHLAEALVDGDTANAFQRVRRLAEDVAWPVPELLSVALVALPDGPDGRIPVSLRAEPEILLLAKGADLLAIVPDRAEPDHHARIAERFGAATVCLGTTRPPEQAPLSLAHAQGDPAAGRRGRYPRGPPGGCRRPPAGARAQRRPSAGGRPAAGRARAAGRHPGEPPSGARGDAGGVAGPPGRAGPGRRGADGAPPDGELPAGAAGRAVRRRVEGPRADGWS